MSLRRTRILATLGPAAGAPGLLEDMSCRRAWTAPAVAVDGPGLVAAAPR